MDVFMRIVSNPAQYKSCWFSYQGAVQGVLNSLGVDVNLSEVISVSGYGWITNAMKQHLCPSAPSAHHPEIWRDNFKATENLGYRIDVVGSGAFIWDEHQKPTSESVKNAKKQFELIKKEIDADRPVVLWGIPVPEYGIVNGYEDEDYVVSTYRPLINQQDSPIHYTGLMAPGGLMFMKFRDPIQVDKEKVVLDTIKRGYRLGSGNVPHLGEYVVGPQAYDVLVKNLKEEEMDENSYHGTAYTFACLTEAKKAVSEYLENNDLFVKQDLTAVTNCYSELSRVLEKCHLEFPMGPGEMVKEKCEKAADWLVEAKKLELAALNELNKIL